MRQIGGEISALFSVTALELRILQDCIEKGQLPEPQAIFSEGPTGALLRFRSLDEARLAKLTVV